MRKKILKRLIWFLSIAVFAIVVLAVYVRIVSKAHPPTPPSWEVVNANVTQPDSGLWKIGNNWFRRSESGLYELYVEGDPFERGVINGKLTKELVQYQEKVFNEQIHRLIPSTFYLTLIKYFVGWFNRDLEKNVPDEFKLEIYGIAQSASHEFDDIAPAYQRLLNYHAAHDIGHALQNMSLVGCTSFATWGPASEDSSLIIGRNFDFYVGDEFARDKMVAFYNPSAGHKFMMVTFGGMTGVLSGMNDQGLTVTINAAKSDMPLASATPVSLVAREILQYASTTDEAYAIAAKRKMFVAESFMIGSAKEHAAAILEKTPKEQAHMTQVSPAVLLCTNHFQSDEFAGRKLNLEHVKTSASQHRMQRLKELVRQDNKNSVLKTARILRDQLGAGGKDIGLGNERSINQLVAHHSIIFQPEKLRVWVSTAPWQLGKYVCYDLKNVFNRKMTENVEVYERELEIPEDPFLHTRAFRDYLKFARYRFPFNSKENLQPDSLVKWNPNSYLSWMLAGDWHYERGAYGQAARCYEQGLTREVATQQERLHMEEHLNVCKKSAK